MNPRTVISVATSLLFAVQSAYSADNQTAVAACPRPPGLDSSIWLPRPGDYVVKVEFETSPKGRRHVTATFHLRCADKHWSGTNMYGWVSPIEPSRQLGAVARGEVPAGNSDNPESPGVLISLSQGVLSLWLGSVANIKQKVTVTADGRAATTEYTDGFGIMLTVLSHNNTGFAGTVRNAGIVDIGEGSFTASRFSSKHTRR